MHRRKFVALVGGTAALAGCLGDTSDDDGDDDPGDDDDGESGSGGSDGDTEETVQTLIDALEEEFDLVPEDGDHGWEVSAGELHAKYYEHDGQDDDIELVGSVFAVAVAAGFDLDTHFTAMDRSDDSHLYEYEIQVGWAADYNADELSEDSYMEQIKDTLSE